MAYCGLTTERRTQLQNRLDTKIALLTKTYNAIDEMTTEVQSYKFDSGEGSQQTTLKKMSEMTDFSNLLERQIDSIQAKLNGTGIINLNLRRIRG